MDFILETVLKPSLILFMSSPLSLTGGRGVMNSFGLKYMKACYFSHITSLSQTIRFHWIYLRFAKVWPVSHFFSSLILMSFVLSSFNQTSLGFPRSLIPTGNTPSFRTKPVDGSTTLDGLEDQ